jgi:hypothetical protein
MKRHSLDVLSLVFGLIFLGIAASWIVRHNWNLQMPDAGWYVAGALIVAGLFAIISTLRPGRNHSQPPADYQPAQYPPPPDNQPGQYPPAAPTFGSGTGAAADHGVITEDKRDGGS